MLTVALPKKIEFQKDADPNQGTVVIEPCFPGYGVTLGNSIRRVLLSSLPGAAVIGVKIEGVSHEFMTLDHLREDILEFILNLKKLRLKLYSNEVEKLELEIHSKKEIKASDIKKNSQVEIVSTDLVLGNIVDMAGKLKAEIFVKKGMGYETIENRENPDKEINYIEIDSIYSPVLAAGIKVENVRVGKQTNFDKLILTIKTDGTITPEEAFKNSVRILIDQFEALLVEKIEEVEPETDGIIIPEENTGSELSSAVTIEDAGEIASDEEAGEPKKKRGRPKKND